MKNRRVISVLSSFSFAPAKPPADLARRLSTFEDRLAQLTRLRERISEYQQAVLTLGQAAKALAGELESVSRIGELEADERAALIGFVGGCNEIGHGCKEIGEKVETVVSGVTNLMGEREGMRVLMSERAAVEKKWRKRGRSEEGRELGMRFAEVDGEVREKLESVNGHLGELVAGEVVRLRESGKMLGEVCSRAFGRDPYRANALDATGFRNGDRSGVCKCELKLREISEGADLGGARPESGDMSKTSTITTEEEDLGIFKHKEGTVADEPMDEMSTARIESETEPVLFRVRAEFSYRGEAGELNFRAGDIIGVLEKDDSGWWKGTVRRQTGLFPSNYTTRLREGEELSFLRKITKRERRRKNRRHHRSSSAPDAFAEY